MIAIKIMLNIVAILVLHIHHIKLCEEVYKILLFQSRCCVKVQNTIRGFEISPEFLVNLFVTVL